MSEEVDIYDNLIVLEAPSGDEGEMFILLTRDGSSLPEFSDEPVLPCIISSFASASVLAARASSSCLLRFSTSTVSIVGLSGKKNNPWIHV